MEKYIKGLSGFILDCATPMTVAVQGDWGSGKTSFMMLIQEEIEKNVIPIWFNTWQFSQFNLGEQLPVMLISKLAAALGVKSQKGETFKNTVRAVGEVMGRVGLRAVDKVSGLDVSGAVEGRKENETKDVTEVVAKLKEQFQDCVEEALRERSKDRVVIFVDDLDRLQPARAVELLEVLKLFLDCDDCVFLLAIDYAVVSQGIRQKYGEAIGADKGRSFFDKIIQVPFKMPVAHYDVGKYVKDALERMELSVMDEKPYVELIQASIGYNPRGMKRLLNAFLLLQRIHKDEKLDEEYEKRLLFAVLCLQLSYEEVYNFVVRNGERLTPEFFNDLAKPESYEAYLGQTDEESGGALREDLDPELLALFGDWGVDESVDTGRAAMFMASFRNALADKSNTLTEKNIGRLRDILNFSAATASEVPVFKDALVSKNGIVGKGVRYANELEPVAVWHAVDERIIFDGAKKLPGWNGSELKAFRLFGEEEPCQKYIDALCRVLGRLYQKNPEQFKKIQADPQTYHVGPLFQGIGGRMQTPARVPGTEIQIETKTMSHQKVTDMKKMMSAMGYAPGELELLARLAHRIIQEE